MPAITLAMNWCELSVYGNFKLIVLYSPKKKLKRQFEHDSVASHKENDRADSLAVWDDDSTCYIVYDIKYDIK